MTYDEQRETLIRYLKHKTEIADWHGVSDAANNLRVLEAQEQGANQQHPTGCACLPCRNKVM